MMRGSWSTIALHTAVSTAFFFLLQRFVLKADMETSLLWAVAGGAGAALLAWHQANR